MESGLVVTATILLVDDEAELLDAWTRVLERQGFRCVTANNAPQAIAFFSSERPDLVLTDLSLPGGDGFEVVRQAQAHSPAIPVIIVTAYNTPENAARARSAGVNGYLPKPFCNRALIQAVRSALHLTSSPHF
jgi:CheY-like chemotaxis protein